MSHNCDDDAVGYLEEEGGGEGELNTGLIVNHDWAKCQPERW